MLQALLEQRALVGHLMGRNNSSSTEAVTEAQAAALFAPTKHFSLSCMYAQLVIDLYLCGIFTMMVANYISHQWNRDNAWTKGVVFAATFMCFVVTAYLTFFISYLTTLEVIYRFWRQSTSITSGCIQGFFAWRAFRLTGRNWFILAIIIMLILTSYVQAGTWAGATLTPFLRFGATVAVMIIFSSLPSELEASKVSVPELIWLSCIMSADIIITISILYGLLRSKTGWAHTDKVITRLIRMTFESQVPPTILAIVFVAEFVSTPSSLFGATLQGIQSKFYGIGLMYSLNSRVNFTVQNVTMDHTYGGNQFAMTDRPTGTIQVEVETETYITKDKNPAYPHYGLNRRKLDEEESDTDPDKSLAFESQARLTGTDIQR